MYTLSQIKRAFDGMYSVTESDKQKMQSITMTNEAWDMLLKVLNHYQLQVYIDKLFNVKRFNIN